MWLILILVGGLFFVLSIFVDKFAFYVFLGISLIVVIRIIRYIYRKMQKTNKALLKILYNDKKSYLNIFDTINESNINVITHAKNIKAKETFVILAKENCIIKYFKDPFIKYDFAKLSDLETQSSLPHESGRLPAYNEQYVNKDVLFEQNHDLYRIGKQYDLYDEEIFSFIVLKNQYKFLKEKFSDNIPDAKFAVITTNKYSMPKFAIIQKRIFGVTLWDLYYYMDAEFAKKKEMIAKHMIPFLDCEHIDFNIENFVVTNENVFYIENKPIYLAIKKINIQNKNNIIKTFNL